MTSLCSMMPSLKSRSNTLFDIRTSLRSKIFDVVENFNKPTSPRYSPR